MKRLVIRGLSSGTANLSPEVLCILKEIRQSERQRKLRFRHADGIGDTPALSNVAPLVSRSASGGGPGRLVFIQLLPGRWIRCTGAMAGAVDAPGATREFTDSQC